jgi:hypothetical protein
MIELSPNTGFMLYLGLTLVILFVLWAYHHYLGKNKKIAVTPQQLFVCEYCQFVYLAEGELKVTQCPQCRSFNKENLYVEKKESPRSPT